MIASRNDLQRILKKEFQLYFPNQLSYIRAMILGQTNYNIWRYIKYLRYLEYYSKKKGFRFAYYSRIVNKLGIRLGIDTWYGVFDEGLLIYHSSGIVINSKSKIGKNCHLHGNNCIGNNGITDDCPVIGDNCILGYGSMVLGGVKLGNNVTVAAGAIVLHSFDTDGIVLAGIPAKIIK